MSQSASPAPSGLDGSERWPLGSRYSPPATLGATVNTSMSCVFSDRQPVDRSLIRSNNLEPGIASAGGLANPRDLRADAPGSKIKQMKNWKPGNRVGVPVLLCGGGAKNLSGR